MLKELLLGIHIGSADVFSKDDLPRAPKGPGPLIVAFSKFILQLMRLIPRGEPIVATTSLYTFIHVESGTCPNYILFCTFIHSFIKGEGDGGRGGAGPRPGPIYEGRGKKEEVRFVSQEWNVS